MALTTVIWSANIPLLDVGVVSTSPEFSPGATVYPYVNAIAVGDFNGDGVPDVVIDTKYGNDFVPGPVLFLTGSTSGGLVDASASLFGGTVQYSTANGLKVADFNGDGRSDVFVNNIGYDASPWAGAQSSLYLSTPSGMTNATANLAQLIAYSHGMAIGDVNGDGSPDVILSNLDTFNPGPWFDLEINNGKGQFTLQNQLLPTALQGTQHGLGYTAVGLYDLNNDGLADLVVGAAAGQEQDAVYLNQGGSFANSPAIPLPEPSFNLPQVLAMTTADINGDGLPDLFLSMTDGAIASSGPGYHLTYIQILINEGNGQFQDQTSLRLPQSTAIIPGQTGGAASIQLTDVDGDGAPDLIVSVVGGGTSIYLNDGTGHFATTPYTIPYDVVPVANYDGTGKMAFVGVSGTNVNVIADDLPSKAATLAPLAAAYQAVMRHNSGSIDAYALSSLTDPVFNGTMTQAAAIQAIVADAQSTSSVATLAYEFFSGSTPTAAGMDYLVSPTGPNPDNLNSAYYAQFSTTNRYINFASNLGKIGAGAAAFQTAYGSLDLADATTKAYTAIFGTVPTADKVSQLLNTLVPDGLGGMEARSQYFEFYGQDGPNGQGTKAAMVGWLLATAVGSNIGDYALSNDAFLTAVAGGTASYGIDLIGQYDQPGYHYTGG